MILLENIQIQVPGFSVTDVNLTIETGEFFALLGPTGSGKTLILETIAGLMPARSGRIVIDGREVTGSPPESRNVGMVYQDSALFPHLSVEKNIHYGLRYGRGDDGNLKRLAELIERLGIGHLMKRSVLHLSGGEKQRVALARALATRPAVLLLDEPLSALDSAFREEVRRALKNLHGSLGTTFILVTHDFSEALYLADNAAVISKGRLQQVGRVQEIFRQPANPFVAGFVGMKNIFQAGFHGEKAHLGKLELCLAGPNGCQGEAKYVGIRPEDVLVWPKGQCPERDNVFSGRIRDLEAYGVHYLITVETDGPEISAVVGGGVLMDTDMIEGAGVNICLPPEKLHLF